MVKLKQLRCSFCRKKESEVLKLVAGPHVYICDACVSIATKLMSDDSASAGYTTVPTIWQKLFRGVRKLLHDWSVRRVDYFTAS